jgi:acylglycerol lipase
MMPAAHPSTDSAHSAAPTPRLLPQETGHFAARDGIQLQYRLWNAAQPVGTIVVMHGFAEHGMRYGHLVDAVVPAGWSVLSFDARGHGQSGGTRVFCKAFQEYTDDLARAIGLARDKLPGPYVLFGHSMGGLVALRLLIDQPKLVDALVLSNPALANKVQVPAWKVGLAHVASRLSPGLTIPSGIPASDISRDPGEVAAYAEDPLVTKDATARWYTEFVGAQAEVLARPEPLRELPTLALIGDGDRIIDPQVSLEYLRRLQGPAQTLHVYPGFYHELLNEPEADRAQVLRDVLAWLASRAK